MAGAGALALSCNAVLGMDEPRPVANQGKAGSGGSAGTSSTIGGEGGEGPSSGGSSGRGGAGGTGGKAGAGGTGGIGGAGQGGQDGGHGGEDIEECPVPCEGDTPLCEMGVCVACRAGTGPRCGPDETPQRCEQGAWVDDSPCAELCTNGVCATMRVVGGLATAGGAVESGSIILVDHGFDGLPVACGSLSGDTTCVVGGFIR